MGNLQPIIDTILADGDKKTAAIKASADLKIKQMRADFEDEKKQTKAEFDAKTNSETERMYAVQDAQRKQMMKTAGMNARTAAVKSAIKSACEHIINLNLPEYADFLGRLYEQTGQTGGIIYLNERDIGRIDKKLFRGSEISDKSVNISGGFIMDCGKINYDCTIEGIAEDRRGELYDIAGKILAEDKL